MRQIAVLLCSPLCSPLNEISVKIMDVQRQVGCNVASSRLLLLQL